MPPKGLPSKEQSLSRCTRDSDDLWPATRRSNKILLANSAFGTKLTSQQGLEQLKN